MTSVAVVDTTLGYEQNGAVLFGEKGAVKPCDAAADYDIVVLFNIGSLFVGGYLDGSFCFWATAIRAIRISVPDSTRITIVSSSMAAISP